MGRYVKFNEKAYTDALTNALQQTMQRVEQDVMSHILNNFGALNLRSMDTKYQAAMRATIHGATKNLTSHIVSSFRAGYESGTNQSFRLVYYEYGTGQKMRPPKNYSPGSDPFWNKGSRPQAIGEQMWTRPYGAWYDAGGNRHFSKYRGKPRRLSERFEQHVPIEPSFWFRRGWWEGTKHLDEYVLSAVKSVPIAPYISIANIYKRM